MNISKQIEYLLATLKDKSSDLTERDDAAIALGAYDSDEVLNCLIAIAADSTERSVIVSSAAESIFEILIRKNIADPEFISSLRPDAAGELKEMLDSHFKIVKR